MKVILREEKSGVSEILGTILILGITVTLFSVIIVWVSGVPAPTAQTRADMASTMIPVYSGTTEVGVNITLTHKGGEALYPIPTVIYVTDQPASGPQVTDVLTLHAFNARLASPNGLLDGTDSVWSIGERWSYESFRFHSSDSITVTVVDNSKGIVVWLGNMNPGTGSRPPIILNIWAAGITNTGLPSPVYAGSGFYLYAQVVAPDGNLNSNSVFANITAWSGSGTSCGQWLPMRDDGSPPDQVAGDGIFSLRNNACMAAPYPAQSWAGTYVLVNATDLKGHQTQTRFTLNVVPNPAGTTVTQTIPSQLWQYIGYVQIRTGEVWLSNLSNPYGTANTYQPFRVPKAWLSAGVLFHFKMANHGNTTIFIDGWTEAFFQNTQSSAGSAMFIVAPCNPSINANAGGVAAYPGSSTNINDFEYAHAGLPAGCSSSAPVSVFDINPLNQEMGGTPYVVMINPKTAFSASTTSQWQSATFFISILVSGMSGPANYSYGMLQGVGSNPYGCSGLGPNYNPLAHLNDPLTKCRTQWYAQVIPFIGMVVY